MIRKSWLLVGGMATAIATGVVGTAAAVAGPADTEGSDRSMVSQEIASTTLGRDLQVTLEASRGTQDETAATVHLTLARFVDGHWIEEQRVQVGSEEGWFWFPLTGNKAICQFSASSTAGNNDPVQERFVVNLLVTASIGCSGDMHYVVRDGRLTPA